MNFEINLIFLIKLFFLHDQNVVRKNLNILRTKKSFLDDTKYIFHHFQKAFNQADNRNFFLVHLKWSSFLSRTVLLPMHPTWNQHTPLMMITISVCDMPNVTYFWHVGSLCLVPMP